MELPVGVVETLGDEEVDGLAVDEIEVEDGKVDDDVPDTIVEHLYSVNPKTTVAGTKTALVPQCLCLLK